MTGLSNNSCKKAAKHIHPDVFFTYPTIKPKGLSRDIITDLNGLTNINSNSSNLNIIDNSNLTDLCGIKTIANPGFVISGNAYNPTSQNFIDGNCSQ